MVDWSNRLVITANKSQMGDKHYIQRNGGGKSINIRTGHIYSEDCTQSTLEKNKREKKSEIWAHVYASINAKPVKMEKKEKKNQKKNRQRKDKAWPIKTMIVIITRKSYDSKNEKYSDDNDNYDGKETEEAEEEVEEEGY